MRRSYKFLAKVLTATIISSCMSNMVLAKSTNSDIPKVVVQKSSKTKKKDVKILGEIVEKRERNIKQFLKDDGTIEAVVYPQAVHYMEDGKWKDIDNTLHEEKEGNENVLVNGQNDFKVKFGKSSNSNKLVTIKKKNMNYLGM